MEINQHSLSIHLQNDTSVLSDFYCGIKEMDDFIHSGLELDIDNRHCKLYTVHNEQGVIVAMFALSFDSLHLESNDLDEMLQYGVGSPDFISDEHAKSFKYQLRYPAMDIAYLAVNKDFQHQHLGKEIIKEIIRKIQTQALAGCQFLTVDAYHTKDYSAVSFYIKCGFVNADEIGVCRQDTVRLYFPIPY